METKEKIREIFFKEVYRSSSARFFGVDKNSFHFKEFEKSFENFWNKIKDNIKECSGDSPQI